MSYLSAAAIAAICGYAAAAQYRKYTIRLDVAADISFPLYTNKMDWFRSN